MTKKNKKVESETYQMDLGDNKVNDSKSPKTGQQEVPAPTGDDAVKVILETYPELSKEQAKWYLDDMSLIDALKVIKEDLKEGNDAAPKQEEVKVTESAEKKENTPSVDEQMKELMREQDEMQKDLEEKQGGVATIDDTTERAKRSEDTAVQGKRRGTPYRPKKGVAAFMAKRNAIHKAQGKPAPYTEACIKATLEKESRS